MCRTGVPGLAAVLALAATVMSQGAAAQEVKVGVVLPYTGVGAELGQQMDRGLELYLKLNADQVKPYKIALIKRDSKAPDGVGAKVAVQELLTQDKVDAIVGFSYSPDAIASAPVISAGKKLAVIANAGTSFITNLSPDFVRTSFTMWHSGYSLGVEAAKTLRAKTAVVAYTDYPPGQGDRRHSGGRPRRRSRFHAILPAGQGRETGRIVRVCAGRRSRDCSGQNLWRARHARRRHQTDRPRRHCPGFQASGYGRCRGRPDHDAPLQCRSRQSAKQAVCRRLEEGIRRRLGDGFLFSWRLRRHGSDRSCCASYQRQDGRRRRGQIVAWMEIR